jgi:aflatoxin B1 aldehyde reductase
VLISLLFFKMSKQVSLRHLPRLYLGTMTFGWSQSSSFIDAEVGTEFLRRGLAAGITYIDSARIYGGGATEPLVGECFRNVQRSDPDVAPSGGIRFTTKAHPSQPLGLSPEGLSRQLRESLEAMGLDYVDEFYLHQPDTENDLAVTLQSAHEFVVRGLVKRIGMSNYHEDEVSRAVELCQQNGWTPPTVYQGLYNPLNRRCESSLLPVLRRHNIDFVAYNALAAGLLSGKHKKSAPVIDGRFKNNPNYLPRYYTDSNFDALTLIESSLPGGLDLISASYQWLLRHSSLRPTDGVLLGASSLEQLDNNLRACLSAAEAAPLPAATLEAFDAAWGVCSGAGAFPYWRSFSRDHPGRELMDPGASYSAAKK